MKLSWIKFLIAGVVLAIVIIFSSIVLFNIVINKIPLPGFEKSIPIEPISGFNSSLHYLDQVAPHDPVRKDLLTEDQAWGYAWPFFHNKNGITLFLPMEKRSLGLHKLIDSENNQYLVWAFDVMQNDYRVYFITGCTHGGTIDIDANTGKILSFTEVC
jgi:hypothetical protein